MKAEISMSRGCLTTMKAKLFGYLFGLVALETAAQFLARKYYDVRESWMFALAIISYILIVLTLVSTYAEENIGMVNALWSATALLTVALVGYLFFDETFTNIEYVGFGLIFTGALLLGINNKN